MILPTLRVLLIGLVALSSGCASTRLTSMVSPEARGKVFLRVLVLANAQDLEVMQFTEQAFVTRAKQIAAGRRQDIVCEPICRAADDRDSPTLFVAAHTILFPGKTYSPDELYAVLSEHRIDATLVLSPSAAGVTSSYVPPTFVTRCNTWQSTTSCSTTSVGGLTLERPWASFSSRLYDARTGETAWIATSRTEGSIGTVSSSLVESMAKRTLEKLIADGVVK